MANQNGKKEDLISQGELFDFLTELGKKKFSGTVKVQYKRGEPRRWAEVTKFRRMGGDNENG